MIIPLEQNTERKNWLTIIKQLDAWLNWITLTHSTKHTRAASEPLQSSGRRDGLVNKRCWATSPFGENSGWILTSPFMSKYIADWQKSWVFKNRTTGAPGWLSRLSIWLLVPAQVMISRLRGFKPRLGLCADSTEPAWDPLSFSLGPSPTHAVSVSLK